MWKFKLFLSFVIAIYISTWGCISSQLRSNLKKKAMPIDTPYIIKIHETKSSGQAHQKWTASIYTRCNTKWILKGKTFLYINNNIKDEIFKNGDLFLSNQYVSLIKKMHHPGEFDFEQYSKINGFFYTVSFDNGNAFIKMGNNLSPLEKIIRSIKESILTQLRKYIPDKKILGIAEAMLIGFKNDIDPTLNKIYNTAGVSHVIAISGMHLGLIYMLISQLFNWIFRKRALQLIALFITLPILWLFAFVTGASASVIRSVIMFSFIIIGKNISKSSSGLNALFGAGFLMMVIDPDTIYDVGFQLSFTAVLSIMIFYDGVKKWVYTKNKLLQKGWSLVAASIAVQILTIPLLIYHFQVYPTYSLLNNMLIVPLSSIALIAEVLLCINPISALNEIIVSRLIITCIDWMNRYAAVMNNLPFSSISFPVMTVQMILLHTLVILGIFFFLIQKNNHILIMTLTCLLLSCLLYWQEQFKINSIHRLAILNMRNVGTIIHQHGKSAEVYMYGKWKASANTNIQRVQNIANHLHIHSLQFRQLDFHPLVIQSNRLSKAIIMMGNDLRDTDARQVLINKNEWIADGSTQLWKIRRWQKDPQNLHLRFLHTARTGPIYLDCKDYHHFFREK
ncbi:MAG: ComEC/Rec2 family competence protein [Bacteroidota bacterium]|jgi:competence protein ComEC